MSRCSLEDHVLQKVSHARFAVALVPRTDQYREVHRDFGARRIGEQEHAQTIIQAVFGNSLDGGDLLGRFGSGVRAGRESDQPQRRAQCGAGESRSERSMHR
jgi:hypothetical protein